MPHLLPAAPDGYAPHPQRAQIFVGDLYGAFGGAGLGAFHDIDALTMFADYRVPVVLRHSLGVLRYSPALEAAVDAKQELAAGCEEELEIRAATVEAVARLQAALARRFGGSHNNTTSSHSLLPGGRPAPLAIQLDWWLWGLGEKARETDPPHHRTRTIYY